jgi:hypothetical protein
VASGPPSARELDAYREQAGRFIAEELEEYYLHFAGLKKEFELEAIYARHADLVTLEAVQRIGASVDGGGSRELARFACEGYLASLTRAHAERMAELEASLEATVDGETIPFRMLIPAISNEPDRGRRARLERARNELTREHLNPVYVEAEAVQRQAVPSLGAATYLELYRDRFGFDLEGVAAQCRALLDSTESLFEHSLDRALRERVGVGLAEAERWDVRRLFRASSWDRMFTAERMLPALRATLGDLGIALEEQPNVHLDVEQRETKSPRAFCAPIEVPDRVILVIQPMGGPDDWRALFHEAGHTEHYAHTSPRLSMEEKRLGDNAVTEGWAMLLEHLTNDPAWLSRRLDFPDPQGFAAEGALQLLWLVRRYSAKLLYELEFHAGGDPAGHESRYVELLGTALKVEPGAADYLADIDAGFYVTSYLRAWAFEAQLRTFLREQWGTDWFTRREAGSLLRELWELGQKPTADELLKDVTGAAVELEAVAEKIRETLPTAP